MNAIQKIIKKLCLKKTGNQYNKYKYLLQYDRYKELKIDLLENKFKIADAFSFYWSYKEIFVDEIYKFDSSLKNPVILDCGSNYGTSVAYFKMVYPDSKIVAVEPDLYIFNLLKWNIESRGYKDVVLINKALSNIDGPINFFSEGADGGRVFPILEKPSSFSVNSIRLDDLICGPIDFLKVDIEGSETDVICSSNKIGYAKNIFIEYHSFKSQKQTLNEILQKVSSCGFRYLIKEQFCSPRPFIEERLQLGMDLQLNIFCKKIF
jgi:FkbM family methyltransferase